MATTHTEADFKDLSWHDCHIWGLHFDVGDPAEDDWTSDLAVDLDFIIEWLPDEDRGAVFRVAPAKLVFHGVADPCVAINWGSSGFQNALHPASIDVIHRERIQDAKVYPDRPYFSWRIILNWPDGGEIAFGAVGFTQTLLAEPVLVAKQHLSPEVRSRLTRRST